MFFSRYQKTIKADVLKLANKEAVMHDVNFDNTTESATSNSKHFDTYSNLLSIYMIPQFLKHHLNLKILKWTALLMLQVLL